MTAPEFSPAQQGQRVRPVYSATAGLSSRQIEAAVERALLLLPEKVKEPIPHDIMKNTTSAACGRQLKISTSPKANRRFWTRGGGSFLKSF